MNPIVKWKDLEQKKKQQSHKLQILFVFFISSPYFLSNIPTEIQNLFQKHSPRPRPQHEKLHKAKQVTDLKQSATLHEDDGFISVQ